MLKLKLNDANHTEVIYTNALETEEYWGGSSRRTLAFECASDASSLDALNALVSSEGNVSTIELSDTETGGTNIFDGYVLKLEIGIKPVLVCSETADATAVYEDKLVFRLGKRTYIEQQLKNLGIA